MKYGKGEQSFSGKSLPKERRVVYWGLQKGSPFGFGGAASVPQHSSRKGSSWSRRDCWPLKRASYWNRFLCCCAAWCSYSDNHLKNKTRRPLQVFKKTAQRDRINPLCFRINWYLVSARRVRTGLVPGGGQPSSLWTLALAVGCFMLELMKTDPKQCWV